jgi:hypothetical protein
MGYKGVMKTFRRDRLRKLIEAGKIVTVSTYHFDDMMGETRGHKTMPVAMKPADWRDRKEGVCYVTEHDLTAKSGSCYVRDESNQIITLIVHSNSNYEFRIVP